MIGGSPDKCFLPCKQFLKSFFHAEEYQKLDLYYRSILLWFVSPELYKQTCVLSLTLRVSSWSPPKEAGSLFFFFLTPHHGSQPMFWLICKPNIFLFLSQLSVSPPPHYRTRPRTQGRCLTEPWILFSCHTFPKRLAAAPIVAVEGGLLGWFFKPPAVALASGGFIEKECGPNNGWRHDIMPPVWVKNPHADIWSDSITSKVWRVKQIPVTFQIISPDYWWIMVDSQYVKSILSELKEFGQRFDHISTVLWVKDNISIAFGLCDFQSNVSYMLLGYLSFKITTVEPVVGYSCTIVLQTIYCTLC